MDKLLDYVEQLMNYLEASAHNLSRESQMELATFIQEVMQFINEFSTQQPTGEPPIQSPPIESGMPSSNVEGFAYDDQNNRLFVRFLGEYPNRNGPVYAYDQVPKVIFELFQAGAVPARTDGKNKWGKWWKGKSPSMGSSVYTLLRQTGFPYERLT